MDFIKAHYEKFILSVVLLGLAAAAALMPMKVSAERDKEEERKSILIRKKVEPLAPLDLTTNEMVLTRVGRPERVRLDGEHNVFNPVLWKKGSDGSIYRASEAGPSALQIQAIKPLMQRVEFLEVVTTGPTPRYRLSVLDETDRPRPVAREAGINQANSMFTIERAIGEPTSPEALEVLLPGDRKPIRITKDKAFERVVGHAADLKHTVENREWTNRKAKDEISFGGESYNIVAITPREVVLSAKSNKKQHILEFKEPSRAP